MKLIEFHLFLLRITAGLLLITLLTGCKEPEVEPPGKNEPSTPEFVQYGTPFAGVPDAVDAVIYQINIRQFSSTRNLQGVTARLDSIRSLGVNVIYLMPVHPVGTLKAINSPYCVKN